MYKFSKKTIAILVVSAFLTSGIAAATDISTSNNHEEELSTETLAKTITLYRYGMDGAVKPIEVNLLIGKNQDIGKAIADKCEELFENDEELQNLINMSLPDIRLGIFSKVKSHGRGLHYQTQLLGKLVIRFILIRFGLPRIHTLFNTPVIFCSYAKDPTANTTITSPFFNRTKYISGNHSVFVRNFVGYTSWCGRFSFSPFDIIPRGFSGFAKITFCIGQT